MPSNQALTESRTGVAGERLRLLRQITTLLDRPMTVLAFVWLGLLIVEFTHGLSGALIGLNYIIWALFGLHFALEFVIAPDKTLYLRRNWLTAMALLLPALRVLRVLNAFRFVRAARAVRSLGLLRLLTSLNRGMGATRRLLRRHGAGYVAMFTLLVILAGAGGMYSFENPAALREADYGDGSGPQTGLTSYGEALWWTAMIMTTMGTDYWPRSVEGRVLCGLLALYAFAIFGYITATIATFFLGQDRSAVRDRETADRVTLQDQLAALHAQVAVLESKIEASFPAEQRSQTGR